MTIKNLLKPLAVLPLAMLLTACGGGSSNSNSSTYANDAYIQFYNGSSNSAYTYFSVDDNVLSASSYGDATSVYTYSDKTYTVALSRKDENGKSVELNTQEIKLKKGVKKLVVLSGDYQNATTTVFDIPRQSYTNRFNLFATSVNSDTPSYDLYMATSGTPFSDAHKVASANYQSLEEGTYWGATTDAQYWPEGDYVFYVTAPGSTDVLYQSPAISMNYATEYVAVVRQGSGPSGNNLVLDLVNSSSTVKSSVDVNASAQYRVYNSLDDSTDLTVNVAGTDTTKSLDVAANTISAFNTAKYGDYRLSAAQGSTSLLDNKLLTLNQGDSKTVLLFKDQNGDMDSLAFSESTLPQLYEHDINVSNLVSDYDNVDVYFVTQDQTIDTASYKVTGLLFKENNTIRLPNGYYQIVVVHKVSSDNSELLYRSPLLHIADQANYIVTVEKESSAATGYTAHLIK